MAAKKKMSKKKAASKKKASAKKKTGLKRKGSARKKATTKKKATSKRKGSTQKKGLVDKKVASKKKQPHGKRVLAKKKAVSKKGQARKKASAKTSAVANKKSSRKLVTSKASSRKPAVRKATSVVNKAGESVPGDKTSRSSRAGQPVASSKRLASNRTGVRRLRGMSRLEQLEAEKETNPPKVKKMSVRDREFFKKLLLNLREHVVHEISFLAGNNLKGQDVASSGEDGTDNFNRESALKLVSSEQDLVYEIDEALRRIEHGTYGICEVSGKAIERERLKVLPHARHCVEVQSEMERGRTRYRPFGPTLSRGVVE